ncbi:uroporphyrinogen-III synthase [Thioclava dalianensis]|nr:uroporphyrinogen-III synthase [Thioclava dalianensis]
MIRQMEEYRARPPLLLTRPRDGALSFAEDFRARFSADWPTVVSPLMDFEAVENPIPSADSVIFTSQEAVRLFSLRQAAGGRVAFCVGARTAQAARAAGFTAIAGDAGAEALLEVILARHARGSILHARGEPVAFDLSSALNSAGIETKEVVLYRQVRQAFTNEARDVLGSGGPVLLPLFSPNSARTFWDQAGDATARFYVAAISPAVAEACPRNNIEHLETAMRANSDGVMDALTLLLRAQMAG